jgi:hypothetical protein
MPFLLGTDRMKLRGYVGHLIIIMAISLYWLGLGSVESAAVSLRPQVILEVPHLEDTGMEVPVASLQHPVVLEARLEP